MKRSCMHYLRNTSHVLLCGPPGSGKDMTLFSALRKLPEVEIVGLNFSSATTPDLVVQALEQHCTYSKTAGRHHSGAANNWPMARSIL
ncbi:hypothetical protein MRB53_039584 [Persea americana]|nr:hypothetical protein MRB53_039584 [Persea americana]